MGRRRWGLTGFAVTVGVVMAAVQLAAGSPIGAGVSLLMFTAVGCVLSPLAFPRSPGAVRARELSAQDGQAIVYWRPGCPYCLRLRLLLGRAGRRMHWVDIWSDPAGAAAVRAVADGNETVPTVILAGQSYVNPDPRRLLALIT